LRDIRRCLFECMAKSLEGETRRGLLYSIFRKGAMRPPIIGKETVAAIAQHIVEISKRWRWI